MKRLLAGDRVKFLEGPYREFRGTVLRADVDTVVVEVRFMGRVNRAQLPRSGVEQLVDDGSDDLPV